MPPLGLFDDEDEKIKAYETSARAKQDDAAKQTSSVDPQSAEAEPAPAAATGRVGRPRTAQNRVVFTIKPRADVRKRIKALAVEHDCTASDVVDALTDQFADALDWDKVGRKS